MSWHPMVKVAKELGICVNTFKSITSRNILQSAYLETAKNGKIQHSKQCEMTQRLAHNHRKRGIIYAPFLISNLFSTNF